MASHDPKAGRALGPTPDHGNFEAEEDPLVELARIVSEDGGFAAPKTEKPKMNRNDPIAPSPVSDGLEAELLQELESSLGTRETPAPPAPPIPPAQRAAALREVPTPQRPRAVTPEPQPRPTVEEERDPEDLLRSIEEQLGQFERRQAERLAATTASFAPASPEREVSLDRDWDVRAEPTESAPPAPEAPRDEWRSGRASRIRPLDISDEPPASASGWEPTPEPPPAPRSEYRFRGPASADWDRAEKASSPEATPARDDYRRIDEPTPARGESLAGFSGREASDADLFAPAGKHRRDPFTEAEPVRDVGDDSKYSTEAFRRRRQATKFPEFDDIPPPPRDTPQDRADMETRLSEALEPRFAPEALPYGDTAADEPRVAAAIAPGASRRAAAARAHAAQRGRARGAFLMIAGVVVVVVLGGAAALYLRSNEGAGGAPVVISADQGPVKVNAAPDKAQASGETVGDAVYDKVAGTATTAPATNEQVVDNTEEPREVARIVLPPPQQPADANSTAVAPTSQDAANAATNEADEAPAVSANEIGPRRVPTYTVRPDGTIVASNDAGQSAPTKPAASTETQTASAATVPAETASNAPASTGATDTTAAASATDTLSPAATETMTPRPAIDEPAEVAVATPPKPAGAAAKANAPVNLLNKASAPAATVPAPAASGGGYLVQVSSQRTQEAAQSAFADMQKRYASVLGSLSPNVQEADLGAKGIYFRVRVGPWASRDEAAQVCESLKAAGGSCLVTK